MTKISVTASIVAIALLIGPIHSFERSSGTGGAASGPSAGTGSAAGSPSAGSAGAGTASVSGVPSGSANAGGLNNSGNDPSGAGNSAKVAAPPGARHQQRRHGQFVGIIGHDGIIRDDRFDFDQSGRWDGCDRAKQVGRRRDRCRRQGHRSQAEKHLQGLLTGQAGSPDPPARTKKFRDGIGGGINFH